MVSENPARWATPTLELGVALQTDVLNPPRLVGRADLLASVESRLGAGGSVVLTGSSGIGKTVVMDAIGAAAAARGERVLRASGAETERWIPYSGLADLLSQVPPSYVGELPEPQRVAINAVLGVSRADEAGGQPRLTPRLAWLALLERCAAAGPVLVLVDDAQWLDAESADVIAYAARRVDGRAVRGIVAERSDRGETGDGPGRTAAPTRAVALAPAPVVEIPVPPLAAHEVAELLELYSLPARAASKVHADSGGNPFLALALGGAFADRPSVTWRPAPLPQRIHALLRDRADGLPAEVRETLLIAALATRPTVELLLRAGRVEAERDIRLAAARGLLVTDGSRIRFTPPAAATVVTELATAAHRSTVHTALSTVVTDAVERARHRALASASPDAEVARSIVTAAEEARRRGALPLAAELYLLAADRTPAELAAERLEWLVAAAEVGAAASRPEVVNRAAEAVIAADSTPAHRVRVRTALIDLSGQALADMDEIFAAALADAGDDPALMAPLRLQLSWQAMLDGNPARADTEADHAVELARMVGDTATEAMALAVKAQVSRVVGRADYMALLERALALPPPTQQGRMHLTPRYLGVRFALHDDRLDVAREELLRMLALVERGGGEELVEVLRCLSEVSAQAGRCAEALDFIGRALRVAQETGLSPGPVWHTAAIAELAGGTIGKATAFAERGCRASEQERDSIYLRRNLHALGQARLRGGDARGGVETLRRIRALERAQGMIEPSVLRWHSDLAAGLIALGELEEAESTIDSAREAVANRTHNAGVTSRLDRAEALLVAERGEPDRAVALLSGAVHRFELLGQPIERGHTLLVLAQVERRRRRHAAARTAAGEALEIFNRIGAKPWAEQASRTLARLDGRSEPEEQTSGALATLTATEARIAAMVRDGASNREIATRMFLSVKTVEATLTRMYRKLGVRSRTQLSSRLGRARGERT
jgi:DNA-binding NarL/FixJ family response regulator